MSKSKRSILRKLGIRKRDLRYLKEQSRLFWQQQRRPHLVQPEPQSRDPKQSMINQSWEWPSDEQLQYMANQLPPQQDEVWFQPHPKSNPMYLVRLTDLALGLDQYADYWER